MHHLQYFLIIVCSLGFFNPLASYHQPISIDLGSTNILDGGPKVITPGFYWIQYQDNYYTDQFRDSCSKPLGGVKSPTFNSFSIITEFLYQSKFYMLGGAPGISFELPPISFTYTSCNRLNLTPVKAGFGNPIITPFFQWNMISYNSRPLFIHRVGCDIILPYGTNKFPHKTINPADIMTSVDTYWAASLYFTEHWAISWHLYYLWSGKNKKTKVTPGTTFHMNYTMEYEVYTDCWVAINGYYLQQLTKDKKHGVEIAHSKERIVSAGPGFACFLPKNYLLLGHLYFETKAINRTQGILAYLDLIKRF